MPAPRAARLAELLQLIAKLTSIKVVLRAAKSLAEKKANARRQPKRLGDKPDLRNGIIPLGAETAADVIILTPTEKRSDRKSVGMCGDAVASLVPASLLIYLCQSWRGARATSNILPLARPAAESVSIFTSASTPNPKWRRK